MSEKIDPIKLSAEMEESKGAAADRALSDSPTPEVAPQIEKPAVKAEPGSADSGVLEASPKKSVEAGGVETIETKQKLFSPEQVEDAAQEIAEGKLTIEGVVEELRPLVSRRALEKQREVHDNKLRAGGAEFDYASKGKWRLELTADQIEEARKEMNESLKDRENLDANEAKEKKEEIEATLVKARQDYVAALQAKEKAEKEEGKLTGLRARIKEFIIGGFTSYEGDKTRLPARQEKISGAQAEAQAAKEKFLKAKENLKTSIKAYRDEEMERLYKKASESKIFGKSDEELAKEMDKMAKEILLATTLREAAKIEDLKAQQQIEQMGKARRFINEKTEEFAGWYKKLPWQAKVGISAGLTGVGIATGSAAVLTAVFAGQASLRALGGAMTAAGVEKLTKGFQEKSTEKKLIKDFDGKFLEALKNKNDALDDKLFELVKGQQSAKNKRMVTAGLVGGVVGTGVLASLVKEAFSWTGGSGSRVEKPVSSGAPPMAVKMEEGLYDDNQILDSAKKQAAEELSSRAEKPSGVGQIDAGAESKGPGAPGAEEVALSPSAEEFNSGFGKDDISLPIGSRGPEGAIIDHLRTNEALSKQYGWDGKTDLSKWAGTKAHQLWLKSVEGELAKPGMKEKLEALGYPADKEGYAKAMHKIGKGFVNLDGQGRLSLSDNTTFLKAPAPALEESGGLSEEKAKELLETSAVKGPANLNTDESAAMKQAFEEGSFIPSGASAEGPEQEIFDRITKAVGQEMSPTVLSDRTFKAAGKITLGQLLEEVPAQAYKDKYALSNYWHSLSEAGVKTPKLPGTGFLGDISYDDWRKYTQMAKLLRENPVLKSVAGLKNLTMEEFFHLYGGDLGKK